MQKLSKTFILTFIATCLPINLWATTSHALFCGAKECVCRHFKIRPSHDATYFNDQKSDLILHLHASVNCFAKTPLKNPNGKTAPVRINMALLKNIQSAASPQLKATVFQQGSTTKTLGEHMHTQTFLLSVPATPKRKKRFRFTFEVKIPASQVVNKGEHLITLPFRLIYKESKKRFKHLHKKANVLINVLPKKEECAINMTDVDIGNVQTLKGPHGDSTLTAPGCGQSITYTAVSSTIPDKGTQAGARIGKAGSGLIPLKLTYKNNKPFTFGTSLKTNKAHTIGITLNDPSTAPPDEGTYSGDISLTFQINP